MLSNGGLDLMHGRTGAGATKGHQHDEGGSDDDTETTSQHSIPLNSPSTSLHSISAPLRAQQFFARRDSQGDSIEIDFNSESDDVHDSLSEGYRGRAGSTPSIAPFSQASEKKHGSSPMTYPPTPSSGNDAHSSVSTTSSYSKKARPESMLLQPPDGPLILGIALVDFNHLASTVCSCLLVAHPAIGRSENRILSRRHF